MRCVLPVLISIHALLAESDKAGSYKILHPRAISIHALLAESDSQGLCYTVVATISIHALLAESDPGDRCGASYPF